MVHGNLVAFLRRHAQASQQVAMHCNAVRVEVRRRHGQENAFLLRSRQDILRQQNPVHCLQLRFQQVGPQCLRAEKVRNEPMTLLNDGKGCKRLGTQVWCCQIRPFSLYRIMRVGKKAWDATSRGGSTLLEAISRGPKSGSGPKPTDSVQRYTAKALTTTASSIDSSSNPHARSASMSSLDTEGAWRLSLRQNCREAKSGAERLA